MDKITTLDTQNPVKLRDVINDTMGQFVPAHIVGATFSAAWLSETEGGSSLTPEAGRLYTVVTAGDYQNQLFRWNEVAYEQVGGEELPENLPVTAHTSAITTAGVTPVADGGLYKYTIADANVTANSYCELIADDPGYVKAQNVRPFFDIADGGIVITVDNAALTTPITGTLQIFDTSAPQSVGAIVNYDNYRIERLETETTSLDGRVADLEAIDIPEDLPVTSAAVVSGTLPTTGWSVADDGWQTTILPNSTWSSVTYGSGKFVAVASTGTIDAAYSLDGITWLASTMPSSQRWNSVTYGNGKFVAVSTVVAYSLDGITWTESTMPSSKTWYSVTYGDGKFVAVASSTSAAAYSLDGITWVEGTIPSNQTWKSVTYGNGKFVAIGGSTATIYSLDGITWTESTMPFSQTWNSVTYGNGKFVAVCGGSASSSKVAYSLDGITWFASNLPASGSWQSVTYGNDKFVAIINRYTGTIDAAYSLDGITWFRRNLPSYKSWQSVTYGNDKFVAVSSSTGAAYWIAADLYNYTITDATVKATSDVLLELTDANAIKAQALEAGKITVQRGTIPLAAIPYTYKVVQTSSTGQFTLVNHFVPTYAEYSVSDYEVTVGDSSSIVYIKLADTPVRSDRYYAFIKGSMRLEDDAIEYDYFVNGSVDLDEALTAINTYTQSSTVPNSRLCGYYPEVPEFRILTPNVNISVPTVKSQTLKLCVINF